MSDDKAKNPFENFKVEIDPDKIDEAVRNLSERARQMVDQGRHMKVRLKYKGRPLTGDIPMPIFAAAEVASFWYAGLMQAIVLNLGIKTFLEVEFIHEADERTAEGVKLYMDGEVEAAEAKFREALKMKPGDCAALYHLGILLRVTGRKDEAVTVLEQAAAVTGHPDAARAQETLDKLQKGGRTL